MAKLTTKLNVTLAITFDDFWWKLHRMLMVYVKHGNSGSYLFITSTMEDGMIILYNGFNNAPIHTYHLNLKALQFHQLDLVLYVCDCFDILVFLVLSSCTYRPPDRDILHYQELCDCISNIVAKNPSAFILCAGDLNLPDIDWTSESIAGYRYPLSINKLTLSMTADCCFTQLINFPTRESNILDVVFTNRPSFVNSCTCIPGISDHDAVRVSFHIETTQKDTIKHKKYLWNKANFEGLKRKLLDFSTEFINCNSVGTAVEHLWCVLRDQLLNLLDEFVPFKMVGANNKQPWVNRTILQLGRKKQRCYNQARVTKQWQHYKCLKRDMQRECRKAYNYYMNKTVFNPFKSGNKKNLFRYFKSLRRDHGGIPTLHKDGTAYSTDADKADILSKHFATVFVRDIDTIQPEMAQSPYPDLPSIETDITEVAGLLKQIDPYKAAGPDGIPSRLLKEIASELSPILTLLFNASLQQGNIPDDWRKALVTPLFKKGNRNDPTNYRPISLTSICCKLLEHIIYSNIMSHLNEHNILSDAQFGFRHKHSAELQLLRTIHDFAFNLNNKKQTDIILLDFSKAFDKVSHRLLKLKLNFYGIKDQAYRWISSFLSKRTQCVVCGGHVSAPIDVVSGVPQGTVLGPLLFLLYINDLPECISSSCSLFADDCLLYRIVESDEDCRILQHDLSNVEKWADRWLMTFNTTKCEVLQITLNNNPIQASYYLYNHGLPCVAEAKYLGITLDSKLTFNKHIDVTCKKANSVLSLLRRNLHNSQPAIKSQVYQIYVRPILEYSCVVWAPHTKCNIDKLESVQRRAARFATSDYSYTSSVSTMLENLNWKTLHVRRNELRLIMFYKIIHNMVDLSLPESIIPSATAGYTRGHDLRFYPPFGRTNVYKYSFFPAVVNLWNDLPHHIVHAPNINTFCNLLRN